MSRRNAWGVAVLAVVLMAGAGVAPARAVAPWPEPAPVPCLDRPTTADDARAAATTLAGAALQRLPAMTSLGRGRFADKAPRGTTTWTATGPQMWTSGFDPALHWLAYGLTGDVESRMVAVQRSRSLGVAARSPLHDVGFMAGLPAALAWRLTGNRHWREVLRVAVRSLQRHWSPGAKAYWSWPSRDARVIVDSMANLPLVWSAREAGVASAADVARAHQHARTLARVLQRPDGSTRHVVDLDRRTGAVLRYRSGQGWDARIGTWTRGQGWLIYGMAQAYRATRDPVLLRSARRAASWWITHLPDDCVPWSDAAGPPTARDTSAASIAADGLLVLAGVDPDAARAARWRNAGRAQLVALAAPPWLRATGPALLDLAASRWTPTGRPTSLVFGDYFAVEAAARVLGARPFGGRVAVLARMAT